MSVGVGGGRGELRLFFLAVCWGLGVAWLSAVVVVVVVVAGSAGWDFCSLRLASSLRAETDGCFGCRGEQSVPQTRLRFEKQMVGVEEGEGRWRAGW